MARAALPLASQGYIHCPLEKDPPLCVSFFHFTGLDVTTCWVANATRFYSVATKFSRLVANLAPKIGDFLLGEKVH